MHLVVFLQPRITTHGTTNIYLKKNYCIFNKIIPLTWGPDWCTRWQAADCSPYCPWPAAHNEPTASRQVASEGAAAGYRIGPVQTEWLKHENTVCSVHSEQRAAPDRRPILATAHFCHNLSGIRIRPVSVKPSRYDIQYGLLLWYPIVVILTTACFFMTSSRYDTHYGSLLWHPVVFTLTMVRFCDSRPYYTHYGLFIWHPIVMTLTTAFLMASSHYYAIPSLRHSLRLIAMTSSR